MELAGLEPATSWVRYRRIVVCWQSYALRQLTGVRVVDNLIRVKRRTEPTAVGSNSYSD
jgi:hypothetical protein